MGRSPHSSEVPSQLVCGLVEDLSLQVFPAAAVSTMPVQPVSVHQQQRPFAQQQPEETLTAAHLVGAVPAVVHPVTPLISIDPGPGVAAVENQVCWEAVGQVPCKDRHTG